MSQSVRRDWIIPACESAAVGASTEVSGAVCAHEDSRFECPALLHCPCGLYLCCRASRDTEKSTRWQTGTRLDACGFPPTRVMWEVPVSHSCRIAEKSSAFRAGVYFPAVVQLWISEERENVYSGVSGLAAGAALGRAFLSYNCSWNRWICSEQRRACLSVHVGEQNRNFWNCAWVFPAGRLGKEISWTVVVWFPWRCCSEGRTSPAQGWPWSGSPKEKSHWSTDGQKLKQLRSGCRELKLILKWKLLIVL